MFDINILQRHDFHDSMIEDIEWHGKGSTLWVNGELGEWERTDNSGCRYYFFYFSKVTMGTFEERDYAGSELTDIQVTPLDSGYHVTLTLSIDLGDTAVIALECGSIGCTLMKYKGMSYENIYNHEKYQQILLRLRQIGRREYWKETERADLGEGYLVEADDYIKEGAPTEAADFWQKCRLLREGKVLFEYESIYRMPCLVAAVIKHQNGRQYFLFKTDLYGLSVYDMEADEVFHYIPEGYQHSYEHICGESFIITRIHYDIETNRIAYDGCYWAGPGDVMVGDFSNPMEFDPRLQSMHKLIDPESDYEICDDVEFKEWRDGRLHLILDKGSEREQERVIDF